MHWKLSKWTGRRWVFGILVRGTHFVRGKRILVGGTGSLSGFGRGFGANGPVVWQETHMSSPKNPRS